TLKHARIRSYEQRSAETRVSLRRLHDLLRADASHRLGERPPHYLLPLFGFGGKTAVNARPFIPPVPRAQLQKQRIFKRRVLQRESKADSKRRVSSTSFFRGSVTPVPFPCVLRCPPDQAYDGWSGRARSFPIVAIRREMQRTSAVSEASRMKSVV